MSTASRYDYLDINPDRKMREVAIKAAAEVALRNPFTGSTYVPEREHWLATTARLRDRAIVAYASACLLVSRSKKHGPHTVGKAELIEEIGTANLDAIEAALALAWLQEGKDGYWFSRPSQMDFRTKLKNRPATF